jgi:hypothetical protein
MGRLVEWAKTHKALAVSLASGLLLLLWLWQRNAAAAASAQASQATGPGGLSAADYTALQQAEIQSGAQLSSQQIAAQAQANQVSAQLQATQSQYGTELQIAQLQQQAGLYSTYAAANVQSEGISAGSAVQLAQISSNQSVSLAQIQAQEQLTQSQLSLSQTLANILAGNPGANTFVASSSPPPPPTVVSSGTSPILPSTVTATAGATIGGTPENPTGSVQLPGSPVTVPAMSAPYYASSPAAAPYTTPVMADALIAFNQAAGTALASSPSFQSFPGPNPYFAAQQTLSNLPGVQQMFSSESAAINAGALVLNSQGQYVPAIPGAQLTY